ncbi:MAG: Cu(I)/Ag(I) efflux system membrane protein CusA/SilA [Patescibacteria group bacterium]|jgi:Cu(I)/Ag(I) efflux system membrane protein CusA/SilA
MLNNFVRFFLENKLVSYLLLLLFVGWGLVTAPFDFGIEALPRDPVAVDAIPDIGENQQIVFTKWMGRSPQDVEDQISYPLTTALLGIPGVKSIRSNSMFGFSSIYIIFNDDIEFYWSRSRILEKLNSLPANTLPEDAQPTLGADATALGQIFWYTLEGQDKEGNATGGWDLHELRTIQDFYVRYGLSAAEGVAEVASIGGFVKEYQVDVDPDAMKANNITLEQVMKAIKESNIDVGAQTIEINLVEYFVRGLGYIQNVEDIEKSVITSNNNVPIRIGDVAKVNIAPATRRGVLDKSGAEAVGGVVIARYGANPLEVIQNVKAKIAELEPGLASKTLRDGTFSQVKIVPFYDRTQLINETIGTLEEALTLEILITIIVVILMLLNLKSSILISGTLPVSVLMCFIAMKYFGVDANIVALSGIAIAIGTMVDMGIVLTESIVNRIEEAPPDEPLLETIYEATTEVASAVITAVATTIISFLPVFTMEASEGKLFKPLAFTKSFALIASIIVAITIIPPLAHTIFSLKSKSKILSYIGNGLAFLGGLFIAYFYNPFLGSILTVVGITGMLHLLIQQYSSKRNANILSVFTNLIYALIVAWLLATVWMPLGVNKSNLSNFFFIVIVAGGLIGFFYLIIYFYENILRFLLRFKILFLLVVSFIVYQGFLVYQNTGEEFMPSLDEGSFLLMPTSMPHSGMQENIKNLRLLDMAVTAIPEVETVVGKAGRINSALDPAPMSMYENVILYKSEYKTNENGHRTRFRYENGDYVQDEFGELIPDEDGRYFRQWRDEIKSPDDIWNEIIKATKLPGVTSAPKLQPIETRLVMLQTGMRAPMGIKVRGGDLATIEAFGLQLEQQLKEVEGVKDAAVFADRIVGKPYLLLDIDRDIISRHGLTIQKVQQYIQAAIGGMTMTSTVEGRERYAIRIRYPRELRNDPEALKRIFVPTANGQQIPLGDLVNIRYEQGAQSIKSEDGFLIGYVLFDRENGFSEVEVVNNAQAYLQSQIDNGTIEVPAGVSYRFAGNYEQQVRANKRLSIVVPIALAIIFLILYFQFKSVTISAMVFTGVFIAFAGGFIMIGLYDTSWFLDFNFFGTNMRDLFQIRTINLSVAVWVGFLALFGIATDDGVLVATFLQDSFKKNKPTTIEGVRDAVVEGGLRRVRPAMMTTATTILALLPVLTATGRGADIMLPMAIPSFGGMTLQMITMFTVPVLYALWKEWSLRLDNRFRNVNKTTSVITVLFLAASIGASSVIAQPLDTLISTAIDENLELKILEKEYLTALERAPQVSQRPDPEVGLGVFPLPVETRLGAQILRVGATHMLPWKGLLDGKKNLEIAKAKALYERIGASALNVSFQIKQAYFLLYEIEKSQSIISRNLELLEALNQLALAKVESGKATAADVLRVQLKTEELNQELSILEVTKVKPTATINQLLNRSIQTPVIIKDSLSFAIIPFDKTTLIANVEANHPMLRMFELQQEVAQQAIKLNDLNNKPTFGVGLDYMMVNKRNDAEPAHNGRDIVQVRASVKIPLYKKKYEAKEREENLKIAVLTDRKVAMLNRFDAAIEQAYAAYQIARLRSDLYQRQIEITKAAINILQTNYSTMGIGFDELLQLEKELIEYDLKTLKAIVQSHLAKSKIERYLISK